MGTRRGPTLLLAGLLLPLTATLGVAPAPPVGTPWVRVGVGLDQPGGETRAVSADCAWRMVVTADEPDALRVLDDRPLAGAYAELALPGPVRSVALAPDASRLYAAVDDGVDGALVVVDTTGWVVTGSVGLRGAPERVTVAHGGRYVVVTSRSADPPRTVLDPPAARISVVDPHRLELMLELAATPPAAGTEGSTLALLAPAGAYTTTHAAVWVPADGPLVAGRRGSPPEQPGLVVGPLFGLELQTVAVPIEAWLARPRAALGSPAATPAATPGSGLALAVAPRDAVHCPSDGVPAAVGR